MSTERDVLALVSERGGQIDRVTKHGTLYAFPTGERYLHPRDAGRSDAYVWNKAMTELRRALGLSHKTKTVIADGEERTTMVNDVRGASVATGKAPARPIGSPLDLKVTSKEARLVLVETTRTLELAPHQIQALVRGAGVSVPDDAKVSLTNEGYVRLSWVERTESVQE